MTLLVATVTVLGLPALYLTARGINGDSYTLGRFARDLALAALAFLGICLVFWIAGGMK